MTNTATSIDEKDQEIACLQADLALAQKRIEGLHDQIEARNDAIYAKDKRIQQMDAELTYQRGVVADLKDKLDGFRSVPDRFATITVIQFGG